MQKLRHQLTSFLLILSQLCIYETAYMKQIFNRKDEDMESINSCESSSFPEFKDLWKQVARREAVHLLMLSKSNINI